MYYLGIIPFEVANSSYKDNKDIKNYYMAVYSRNRKLKTYYKADYSTISNLTDTQSVKNPTTTPKSVKFWAKHKGNHKN